MKHAFLSRSFAHRQQMQPVAKMIQHVAIALNIDVYDFVTRNKFDGDDAVAMMTTSFAQLEKSDFIIAEVTHKAIGIGIEIGYAAAKNKPILYLRHQSAEHSTTTGGIATLSYVYENRESLAEELPSALQIMLEILERVGTNEV